MPERWTLRHIAEYAGLSYAYVRDHLSKSPGFPAPLVKISRKTKFYDPLAVRRWAGERV